MAMTSCCPICYKIWTVRHENCEDRNKRELVQQRFFKFFQRYLNEGNGIEEINKIKKRKPIHEHSQPEKLSELGMLACQDCLSQMESFCDLYDKLKATELLLNWKVWTMKNIMTGAQRVSSRIKAFREFTENVEVEAGVGGHYWGDGDEIINFIAKSRKMLIGKCSRKVDNVTPILSIPRWEPGVQQTCVGLIEDGVIQREVGSSNANSKSVDRATSGTDEAGTSNILKEVIGSSSLMSMSPSPSNVSITEDINADPVDHGELCNNEEDDDHQSLDNSFSKNTTEEFAEVNEKSPYFDNFPGPVKVEADSEFVEESFTEPAAASEVYQNNATSLNMESDDEIHRPLPALESVLCINTVRNDNGEESLPLEPETITETTPSNSSDSRTWDGSLYPETRSRLRPTHKCSNCGRTFSTVERLQSHEQEAHGDDDDNFNDLESILSVDEHGYIDIDRKDGSPALSLSSSSSSDESDNDFGSPPDTEEDLLETKILTKSPLEVATTDPWSQTISEVENPHNSCPSIKEKNCKPKEPVKHPKFRLRCPDCQALFEDVEGILTHRKFSPTCSPSYDPKLKIIVDVLVPPAKSGNDCKDDSGDDGSNFSVVFAKISLPPEIYLCDKCQLAVYSFEDMESHNKLHGSFCCQFCGATEDYAPDLSLHELEHAVTEGKEIKTNGNHPIFYCARCDYGVGNNRESYIIHHLKAHLGLVMNRPKCAICKTNGHSVTNLTLSNHFKTHHDLTGTSSVKGLRKCPEQNCRAYFLQKLQLNNHMKLRHHVSENVWGRRTKNSGRRKAKCKVPLLKNDNDSISHETKLIESGTLEESKSESRQQDFSSADLEKVDLQHNSSNGNKRTVNQAVRKPSVKTRTHTDPTVGIEVPCTKPGSSRDLGRHFRLKCPDCKHLFRDVKSFLIHRRDSQSCSGTYDPNASIKVEVLVPLPGVKRKETIVFYRIADKYFTNIFAIIDLPQRMFGCEDCDLEFYSSESLEAHKALHEKFKCNFCPMELTYAKNLAIHELQHFSEKGKRPKLEHECKSLTSVKCPRCELTLKNKSQYVRHYLNLHMSLKWIDVPLCAICKTTKTTLIKKDLGEHFRTSHDLSQMSDQREIVRCQISECDAYFLTRGQLSGHLRYHHNYKTGKNHKGPDVNLRFNCKDCDKSYAEIHTLSMHRLKYHVPLDKVFPCPFEKCNLIYETRQQLELHLACFKERHKALDKPNVKEFVNCPVCNKRVSSSRSSFLKIHMRSHETSHVCEECGMQFKTKHNLENHKLAHSGPESWQFSCSVCNKKCLGKGKLNEHMRTHTKETPYVCEICGQKYAHRHNLRIHVNSKHGDVVQDIPRKISTKNFTSKKGTKRKRLKDDPSNDEDHSD